MKYTGLEYIISAMKFRLLITLLVILSPSILLSQELPALEQTSIDWNVFNMAGLSFSSSYRTISESSGSGKQEYRTDAIGITYTNFTGSRIGFFSQLSASFPFGIQQEGEEWEINTGFILDYTGAVGWTLKAGNFGFMPYAGFHTAYTFLSRDPSDNDNSNHMISFGLSLGCNFLFYLNRKSSLYGGLGGYIDTIEFTSASYDSRNRHLERKLAYMLSIGYAYTPGTVQRVLQPDI